MNFRENMRRSREVLGAYFRQGLRELGAALYNHTTVAQPPEYGVIGTKTPGQVAEGLRPDKQLDSHMREAAERQHAEPAPERDHHDLERD